jgi:hypothetical protein
VYQLAVQLPPFTNREDYFLTFAMVDDDTLDPIDFSGITLAPANPNGLTAAAWTVTDGAIVTASVTQFTIPAFPVTKSNNLTALAITVGAGLAIKAADPITVADTATGLNSVFGFVANYSANTGALVIQVGWTFQFELRRGGARNTGMGYIQWWDWGTPDDLGPLLSASFANGFLSLTDKNIVQILIPESVVKTLGSTALFAPSEGDAPGTYRASMTGTDSVNTRQLLMGLQPVYDGGVSL